MKNIVFADTNVFLDAILQREPADEDCKEILEMAYAGDIKTYTSVSCLLNVIYFLEKAEIPSQAIIEIMEKLLNVVSLSSPDEKIFTTALHAGFADLEDAVQYHTALHVKGMDYFITSNVKDFKKATSQLSVLTPKQFMKKYNS